MDSVASNSIAFEKFADYQVNFAIEMRLAASEQIASSSRWLAASLFALNGTSIVVLLQIDDFPKSNLLNASVSFIVGILFCFLMVIIDQIAQSRRFNAFNLWGDFWSRLQDPKHIFDEKVEFDLRRALLATNSFIPIGWILGLFSLFGFIIGCWLASEGL